MFLFLFFLVSAHVLDSFLKDGRCQSFSPSSGCGLTMGSSFFPSGGRAQTPPAGQRVDLPAAFFPFRSSLLPGIYALLRGTEYPKAWGVAPVEPDGAREVVLLPKAVENMLTNTFYPLIRWFLFFPSTRVPLVAIERSFLLSFFTPSQRASPPEAFPLPPYV